MTVWSTVPISTLEYSRLDAEFYHPTYLNELESWHRLKERIGTSKLGRLIAVPVRTGRTPKSRSIKGDEKYVHFIKTDTVREGSIGFDNSALLPKRIVGERDIIPEDAVVMTIIGATPEIVGRTAIVRANDPMCVTNQNIAVILTNEACDPYFLTAYFQTTWGRDQVWRHSRRTEQVNLNCREVERILVPNPPITYQETIGALVRDAFAATDRSIVLYREAQQLLKAELGLDKLTFQKPVSYTAWLSDLNSSRRADAEFFHVGYDSFISLVKSYPLGWSPLGNLTSRVLPNFKARKHSGDFEYIEIGDVSIDYGTYTTTKINSKDIPANAIIKLSGGEILFSQVRPTRGAIAIVNDELDHSTVSSGAFYVCKANNVNNSEIIWLYLRIIRNAFEKYCGGTSYPTIDSRYITKFPVPHFVEDFALRLRELILESKNEKRKSDELLKQAKASVEKLIKEAIQR